MHIPYHKCNMYVMYILSDSDVTSVYINIDEHWLVGLYLGDRWKKLFIKFCVLFIAFLYMYIRSQMLLITIKFCHVGCMSLFFFADILSLFREYLGHLQL